MNNKVKLELDNFVHILNLYTDALAKASVWNDILPPDGEIMRQNCIRCVSDQKIFIQGKNKLEFHLFRLMLK